MVGWFAELFMDVLERTLLNDNLVQTQFHLCSLYDSLLHRVFCDETKHTHRLCLADTMSTILFGCEERMCVCGWGTEAKGSVRLRGRGGVEREGRENVCREREGQISLASI